MKFNFFGKEKIPTTSLETNKQQKNGKLSSGEVKLQKARDIYDEQVTENAKDKKLDTEDVVRVDAETEDYLYNKSVSEEEKEREKFKELLKKNQKSTLTIVDNLGDDERDIGRRKYEIHMQGVIAEKNIDIIVYGLLPSCRFFRRNFYFSDNTWEEPERITHVIGEVDGEKISNSLTKEIFLKYKYVAWLREASLNNKRIANEREARKQELIKNENVRKQLEALKEQNEKRLKKEEEEKIKTERDKHSDILS